MKLNIQISELLKVGLYASPLIGVLSITPIFIIKELPLSVYPKAVAIVSLVVFSIWWLNILFIHVLESIGNKKLKKLRYLLSYVLMAAFILLAISSFKSYLPYSSHIPGIRPPQSPYASFVMWFSINTVVLILLDLLLLREKKVKMEIENANLKLMNAEAINQQLRQQIHPHFLFNSLNTLKSLIKKSPDAAEDYLVMLSDFLRRAISTGNEHLAKVSDEVKLCIDYLEMQKIRYCDALLYEVHIPETVYQSGLIPAFSLQFLVENAIKHNALTNELPLLIKILYDDDRIIVINNIQPKFTSETSTGFGLTNLAERYKILSGDEIIIRTSDNQFSVSIKIIGDENSNY